ncbi:hypothetical protein [Aurantiacibacter odishensis]|uniref:hypothetical protein n=1 Tax=Aurantiacibacter odishensis TaxID=1155476 RepID=UPI0013C4617C|nr:hypothetical protein [Aurantiacibacter odishensis]
MAIGSPRKRSASLNVLAMLIALAVSAFIGATAGLIWQSAGWFEDEPEHEVVTAEAPGD